MLAAKPKKTIVITYALYIWYYSVLFDVAS